MILLILSISLSCSHNPKPQAPIEVKIPVIQKAVPPPELIAPLIVQLPTFIAPSSPTASSALDMENERVLRAMIQDLIARIRAWQAWALDPPVEQPSK